MLTEMSAKEAEPTPSDADGNMVVSENDTDVVKVDAQSSHAELPASGDGDESAGTTGVVA